MEEREQRESANMEGFFQFNKKYSKAGFWRQVGILLRKNAIVTLRKWNFITAHLLTVTLVCLVILFINYLTRYSYENEPSRIYDVEEVGDIRKCDFDPNCKSLGYILIGDQKPWTSYVLNDIAKKSGLSIDDDFKKLYEGNSVIDALSNIKKNNQNTFSTIVMLCTSSITIQNFTLPCDALGTYTYWLLYNQTLVKQNFLDNMNAPLKLSMDAIRTARMVENALSNYILQHDYGVVGSAIQHNYTAQDYPKVQSRMLVDFDTSSSQGSFWFFIPIMISFLNLNTEIINEKERKLRQGLMLHGISSLAYWLSWLIFIFLFDLVFAALLTASGYICRFSYADGLSRFFVNCPPALIYLPFFLTLFSNHMLGMMLCTLVSDNKSGSKYGYSIMLISIFYQIFFSNGMFLELIYTKEKPWGIMLLYYFMYINPSFHFCNILVNIISTSGNHFNMQTTMWEKGVEYEYSFYKREIIGSLFGRNYVKPSPMQSVIGILYNTASFAALLWVFDNLVASNRGFSRNPFYFVAEWLRSDKSKVALEVMSEMQTQNGPMDHKPMDIRQKIVVEDEKCLNGIVMTELWKSYKLSCSRGKNPKSDWALQNINLQIRQGELLALLGPNGAGKTTMIGIISGILEPTRGTFFSNGFNSQSNKNDIRNCTNVCPQFDILWDELTVLDHIRMVGRIKGVAEADIQGLATCILKIVNLDGTINEKISSLSGGMKRRISIALATIGNPAILIFDEPTTGLDPENRRIIWKFINKLKESKRTILLTTHLLEEADILSDRISIMSYGKIKIVGNSSELKRKIGSGFKLNIIIKDGEQSEATKIKEYTKQMIPQATLLDESAGSMLYSIPFTCTEQITAFLEDFEANKEIRLLVEDISISNSTLEEVFISVTKDSEENEEGDPLIDILPNTQAMSSQSDDRVAV